MRGKGRSGEKPLKAAIEEFLDAYRLRDKMNETKALGAWEKVVGKVVAKNTGELHIRRRVLYVRVTSAALRNELLFARRKIIDALNREAGAKVIDDIVLN